MMAENELEPIEATVECWWPPVKSRKIPYMDVWEHRECYVADVVTSTTISGELRSFTLVFIECVTNAPVQLYLKTERRGPYVMLQLIDSRELIHAARMVRVYTED
jgi:hypothetical protein